MDVEERVGCKSDVSRQCLEGPVRITGVAQACARLQGTAENVPMDPPADGALLCSVL
jgi:hypothetical protein